MPAARPNRAAQRETTGYGPQSEDHDLFRILGPEEPAGLGNMGERGRASGIGRAALLFGAAF